MKAMQKDVNLRYQSATEMLKDLNAALKNPDDNFVHIGSNVGAATQRISTQEIAEAERKAKEANNPKNGKKPNKFIQFVRKHKALSFVIGAIILFFVAFGATMGIVELVNPNDVQIPDLVNKTQDEAEQIVKELKLKLVVKSEEYNENVEEGKIISQDPAYQENYTIKEHSEISVVISKGTETVEVPDVVGKTREEAEKLLKDAGLVAEITEENDEKVEAGIVLSQDIEDGETVNKGSTVKLVVSKGSGIVNVEVPSLVGKTEQEAKNLLTEAGLKVNVVNDEDESKNDGVVLRQSKDAGTEVQEGTTITITVNKVSEEKTIQLHVNVNKLAGNGSTASNTTTEDTTNKVSITINGETREVDRSVTDYTGITLRGRVGKTITISLSIKEKNGDIIYSTNSITYTVTDGNNVLYIPE